MLELQHQSDFYSKLLCPSLEGFNTKKFNTFFAEDPWVGSWGRSKVRYGYYPGAFLFLFEKIKFWKSKENPDRNN